VAALERTERWIEIYDCAFRDDDIVFTGDPRAPDRSSVRILLHELGHALAGDPVHLFYQRVERLSEEGKALTLESASSGGFASAELTKLAERLRAVVQRVAAGQPAGPAVTAFSRLPGANGGITSYGRQSAAEAFAEAFSLYHADPEALRRVCPAALEFFERGAHLASAR
jgi:hypothetical protein